MWIGKYLSDKLPTKNGLKHGDALLPVLLIFALEYATQKAQTNQEGLKVNGTYYLPIYANHVNLLGEMHTVMCSTEVFIGFDLLVNAEKSKYMYVSCKHSEGQNHSIKTNNKSFESVTKFRYFGNKPNESEFHS
jgi:hypothetical protein